MKTYIFQPGRPLHLIELTVSVNSISGRTGSVLRIEITNEADLIHFREYIREKQTGDAPKV
jgi:hypothetical protein